MAISSGSAPKAWSQPDAQTQPSFKLSKSGILYMLCQCRMGWNIRTIADISFGEFSNSRTNIPSALSAEAWRLKLALDQAWTSGCEELHVCFRQSSEIIV